MKKMLSVVLTTSLLLGTVAFGALAQGDYSEDQMAKKPRHVQGQEREGNGEAQGKERRDEEQRPERRGKTPVRKGKKIVKKAPSKKRPPNPEEDERGERNDRPGR